MAKLIMLLVIIATIGVPMTLAQRKAPKSSLRTTQIVVGMVILLWGYLVTHVYPQLVPID